MLTAVLMLPVIYYLAVTRSSATFALEGVMLVKSVRKSVVDSPIRACIRTLCGTVGGLIFDLVIEYFASHTYTPMRELATACMDSSEQVTSVASAAGL